MTRRQSSAIATAGSCNGSRICRSAKSAHSSYHRSSSVSSHRSPSNRRSKMTKRSCSRISNARYNCFLREGKRKRANRLRTPVQIDPLLCHRFNPVLRPLLRQQILTASTRHLPLPLVQAQVQVQAQLLARGRLLRPLFLARQRHLPQLPLSQLLFLVETRAHERHLLPPLLLLLQQLVQSPQSPTWLVLPPPLLVRRLHLLQSVLPWLARILPQPFVLSSHLLLLLLLLLLLATLQWFELSLPH